MHRDSPHSDFLVVERPRPRALEIFVRVEVGGGLLRVRFRARGHLIVVQCGAMWNHVVLSHVEQSRRRRRSNRAPLGWALHGTFAFEDPDGFDLRGLVALG